MKNNIQSSEQEVKKFTLCGVQGCCPTVEVNSAAKKIFISDDFGGKVVLTDKEWQEAVEKVRF